MFKTLEKRERLQEIALYLLFVTAGGLIVIDWLRPELRVGRVGGSLLVVAVGIALGLQIKRSLSRAWWCGDRAGYRRAKHEEATEEPQLAVIHDMARPR